MFDDPGTGALQGLVPVLGTGETPLGVPVVKDEEGFLTEVCALPQLL